MAPKKNIKKTKPLPEPKKKINKEKSKILKENYIDNVCRGNS